MQNFVRQRESHNHYKTFHLSFSLSLSLPLCISVFLSFSFSPLSFSFSLSLSLYLFLSPYTIESLSAQYSGQLLQCRIFKDREVHILSYNTFHLFFSFSPPSLYLCLSLFLSLSFSLSFSLFLSLSVHYRIFKCTLNAIFWTITSVQNF